MQIKKKLLGVGAALAMNALITSASADTTFTLKGLGDQSFATVRLRGANLTVEANGVPHSYYKNKLYMRVQVWRGSDCVFNDEFIGDKRYGDTDNAFLSDGDRIVIYHAEPSRINFPAQFKSYVPVNSFTYEYRNGTLTNLTDKLYYTRQINNLRQADGKLAIGISQAQIDNLKRGVQANANLTDNDRKIFTDKLADIQREYAQKSTQSNLPLNVVARYEGYRLPKQTSKQIASLGGKRIMGSNQDLQALGPVLENGATIAVRQTNPNYILPASIRLIGNDSKKYQTVHLLDNNWTLIHADGDQIPFLSTQQEVSSLDAKIKPVIEWKIVQGSAKALPTFIASDDQKKFIQSWNDGQASFALIKGSNFQIIVPRSNLVESAQTDLKQLVNKYDQQIFPFYNNLAGSYTNTSLDDHTKGKYTIAPDIHGVGAAYYSPGSITAQSENSVSQFLKPDWIAYHELGHGYDLYASDIYTPESFNNIYGLLFQVKYTPEVLKNGSAWLYGGNEWNKTGSVINEFEQGKKFNDLSYHARLYWWMNLAYNLEGESAFKKFNAYYTDLSQNRQATDKMGNLWVQFYKNEYHLNIVPYLNIASVPVDTLLSKDTETLPAIAMLYQVLPNEYLQNKTKFAQILQQLSEDKNVLATKALAVTNQALSKTGLHQLVTFTLTDDELAKVKNATLQVLDGTKIVKEIPLTSSQIKVDLPNGIYRLKLDSPDAEVNSDYIYVKDAQQQIPLTFTGQISKQTKTENVPDSAAEAKVITPHPETAKDIVFEADKNNEIKMWAVETNSEIVIKLNPDGQSFNIYKNMVDDANLYLQNYTDWSFINDTSHKVNITIENGKLTGAMETGQKSEIIADPPIVFVTPSKRQIQERGFAQTGYGTAAYYGLDKQIHQLTSQVRKIQTETGVVNTPLVVATPVGNFNVNTIFNNYSHTWDITGEKLPNSASASQTSSSVSQASQTSSAVSQVSHSSSSASQVSHVSSAVSQVPNTSSQVSSSSNSSSQTSQTSSTVSQVSSYSSSVSQKSSQTSSTVSQASSSLSSSSTNSSSSSHVSSSVSQASQTSSAVSQVSSAVSQVSHSSSSASQVSQASSTSSQVSSSSSQVSSSSNSSSQASQTSNAVSQASSSSSSSSTNSSSSSQVSSVVSQVSSAVSQVSSAVSQVSSSSNSSSQASQTSSAVSQASSTSSQVSSSSSHVSSTVSQTSQTSQTSSAAVKTYTIVSEPVRFTTYTLISEPVILFS